MKNSKEWSSQQTAPGHDGAFDVPISRNDNDVDVEFRVTSSRLRDEDIEDAVWEDWIPSKHEPRLLPYIPSEESDFAGSADNNDAEEVEETYDFDVSSVEDLNIIKSDLQDIRLTIKQWAEAGGLNDISDKQKAMLQRIGLQISDVNDLIRFQNEALATGVPAFEIQSRGEKISLALGNLLETYDQFSAWVMSGEEPESEKGQKKTGWWDKDFQKERGVSGESDEVPTQKWGEQDGPIGFEPPQTEPEEDKERTGWWKDEYREYREDLGFGPSVPGGPLTQRGDLSVPGDPDSLNTDRFVSEPVSGGRKGEVKWSVQGAESLSAEPALGEVPTPEQIMQEPTPEVTPVVMEAAPLDNEILTTPINPDYEKARQGWMEAKTAHESAHTSYNKMAAEYYEGLNELGFLNKNWTRLKASLGFKPQLPPEIAAMREDMFAATEAYNRLGHEMLESRTLAGKESRSAVSSEVLVRYQRLLARSLVLNTFNEQRELQTEAAESLNFKPGKFSEFFKKNKKGIRLVGAATVGVMTGGLGGVVVGGVWWARATAGAAASVAATKFVGGKMDSYVDNVEDGVKEQYKAEVDSIESWLSSNTLNSNELEGIYNQLSHIYYRVDIATQRRIAVLLSTALGTGLLAGVAAGAATEMLDMGGTPDTTPSGATDANEGLLRTTPETTTRDIVGAEGQVAATETASSASDSSAGVETASESTLSAQTEDSPTTPSETAPPTPYVAEKGDNLWDIMEGQTDAGKPVFLDHVAEGDRQRLIALVAERVNQDDALRAELGFGETADDLNLGAEVDTTRLNEIAEEIAKEKGLYIEVAPDGAEAPQAPETPPADAGQPEALNAEVTPEAAVVTNVSPDKNYDFAHSYPEGSYLNGFQNFRHDFQTQWVNRIQGPPPVSGGFLASFFSSAPLSDSAYNEFDAWDVGEFKKLATIDESVLASTLDAKNIDMADYRAWRDEIAKWEQEGLMIDPKDRFSDVAETAFINFEKSRAV